MQIMVCFADYIIKVPKNNLEQFRLHILENIYGLDDEDLWFLDKDYVFNPNKYHYTKLISETEEYYEIKFRWCTFTALGNVLPETLINVKRNFFSNKEVLNAVKSVINDNVLSARDDICREKSNNVIISVDELPNLIKQLAIDNVIQKYFKLKDKTFICVARGIPLLVSVKDQLYVNIIHSIVFNHDNGFLINSDYDKISPFLLKPLNVHFKAWKEAGNITLPVIPPNDLRE